tara:strand:+ start:227 stop:532 length:306 start_codon:yes stop_codon:yes gene_type:complete
MKKIIVIGLLLGLSTLSLQAEEKKEKWFEAGVKPDPHITIPFIGVKTPLPTVCAGKDVSTSFDVKLSKESFMLKLPYFKIDWDFPAISLGRGKAKVTLGTE